MLNYQFMEGFIIIFYLTLSRLHREIVHSTKEELAALQRRTPKLQPLLAIVQVFITKHYFVFLFYFEYIILSVFVTY